MQLPPHGFAHPPATDPPRNLSAYLSLVNPISPEQADLMPGRYVPPPPEDPTALLMNAVSQQQQHNAAMALLQNSHTPDSLGNVYASSYSATAPHSMHFQPPVAYSTGVNLPGPYGSAQPLSAYSGSLPSNVGVPDWNAQMPSLSQDVQMGQLAQLPQAPQYSPELLSLLAANQIPAVDHHAFNGLPNQVDLPSQMQSPLGHMDHMPADSQHMPRLSHNPCEDAYSHLASLGCGSSSVGNRQQVRMHTHIQKSYFLSCAGCCEALHISALHACCGICMHDQSACC